ncbi:hypothetical protein [Arthrobacter sp. PAMC25284]|uniref:hypothetical protein n=1 Tax=Arthrobacter sp. PAMC25284 TaxID=2861279 RepID=UPI001C6330A8|nr:hypothetical protein [Arthrobacter sp. PAMC25284]QYF88476.1 hypothetical protein KY499_09245 [Arthrobacter sp. PAMC25284]
MFPFVVFLSGLRPFVVLLSFSLGCVFLEGCAPVRGGFRLLFVSDACACGGRFPDRCPLRGA